MARKTSYSGKYKISKSDYMTAKWYALRFNSWLDEYNALSDSVRSFDYTNADMPKAVNKTSNPTEDLAERRAELRKKMDLITRCCHEAGGDLSEYLFKAVTNEEVTYKSLVALREIPCSANTFYDRRQKFYYLLSKEI